MQMDCDRARAWLPRLLDRELPFWRRWQLRRHLAACQSCGAEQDEQRDMQSAFRDQIVYHRAPPALAARISGSLPRETIPRASRPWFRLAGPALGGTGLAGALAGAALVLLVQNGASNGIGLSVTEAVIDSHIASMMANHLTDVQTSDQHTVKPWLSAHSDVSPPVRDLAPEGFPLIGGRLDYIDGHPAVAVVYRRDKHIINLFAWASSGRPDAPPRREARQGFNVITWRQASITYFAVSDVEADQLARFVQLVRQGSA
jgi:anti-sigma factor RsiW